LGLRFGIWVEGLGLRIQDLRVGFWGLGFAVWDLRSSIERFGVWDVAEVLRLMVWSLGF
jgi:hypothetical protein